MAPSPFLVLRILLAFYTALAAAITQEPIVEKALSYKLGDPIPVTCLNRTVEGEHVTDTQGNLQYIPFPVCNETGRPWELYFGIEKEINCTISFIEDSFFHLLEYYVHNDSPFACRIPSRPLSASQSMLQTTASTDPTADLKLAGQGSLSKDYIPLVVALTGTLQLSHLHIASHLNVLLHAAPKSVAPGVIAAGTAYSIDTTANSSPTRIVIGDALPLRFSVRWYPNTVLPSGWTGIGGHLYLTTLVYCALSAGAATAICIAYFRGIELPRRLKSHGRERTSGMGVESGRLGGYGYGIGAGMGANGFGSGKRD